MKKKTPRERSKKFIKKKLIQINFRGKFLIFSNFRAFPHSASILVSNSKKKSAAHFTSKIKSFFNAKDFLNLITAICFFKWGVFFGGRLNILSTVFFSVFWRKTLKFAINSSNEFVSFQFYPSPSSDSNRNHIEKHCKARWKKNGQMIIQKTKKKCFRDFSSLAFLTLT